MQINILYEDMHIVVCIKPSGIVSENNGMPELLRVQCGCPEIFCVHRLDKNVGGVIVFAKTKVAAAGLSADIASGSLKKEYLALVQGIPDPESGIMHDLLYHDRERNKTYIVGRPRRGVKEAELEYKTVSSHGELSLVHIILHTGRSHQIRCQFASRSMPLAGDGKYGSRYRCRPLALWAYRLSFVHPVSGAELSFEALPPDELFLI